MTTLSILFVCLSCLYVFQSNSNNDDKKKPNLPIHVALKTTSSEHYSFNVMRMNVFGKKKYWFSIQFGSIDSHNRLSTLFATV